MQIKTQCVIFLSLLQIFLSVQLGNNNRILLKAGFSDCSNGAFITFQKGEVDRDGSLKGLSMTVNRNLSSNTEFSIRVC
jgi:hypothetical protein